MAIKLDKNKLTRKLADHAILAPHLDKVFDTFDEPFEMRYEEKQVDTAWHPSGDCTPKVTDLYASRLEGYTAACQGIPLVRAENEISGSLRKSFMVGHFWHALLQHIILKKLEFAAPEAIEAVGFTGWGERWMKREAPENCHTIWQPYHWVRGQGDIAPLVTSKWQGIVDIKTMSSNQFRQATLPEWAAAKYLCQLNIYMHLFDEEQGMILAVNKDAPHDFKELTYTRDQKLIDAIVDKWKFVSQAFVSGYIPTEIDDKEYCLPI